MLYLNQEFAQEFQQIDPFDWLRSVEGEVFREVKDRRTVRFSLNNKSYFVKFHAGVGWREIFKNLFQLRLPILGAENEWKAIAKLESLGVATMKAVAYGKRGWNPASIQSFVVTEELAPTISLEDYCKNWLQLKPGFQQKKQLIEQVAQISKLLHRGGVCHRDYYLCHFLLHGSEDKTEFTGIPELSLIDLHRALIKNKLTKRWVVKDISGLYYSAMEIGLTRTDLLRFIRIYSGDNLRQSVIKGSRFWTAVENRGNAMYKKLGSSG